MSPEKTTNPTKLCPTCGTRVAAEAARCLVCGSDLTATVNAPATRSGKPTKTVVQGSKMPEITLSIPAILGLVVLTLSVGAALVYFTVSRAGSATGVESTASPTPTVTELPTVTPTPSTPTPTWTPEPSATPFEYRVKLGDTCGSIAYSFGVSIQSIVMLNDLPADCGTLFEDQMLRIPQPTPTATAPPTSTLGAEDATEAACEKLDYVVQENDTLSSISLNYNIAADVIREENGMVNDIVRYGETLVLPLCRRNATPGPTPTPTLPPPYAPVNLLLPGDGAPFSAADEVITLQWAATTELQSNESYAVTLEDLTDGQRKIVEYVSDNKLIVPDDFLTDDRTPHVIRWWVVPVRQIGTDNDGKPIWSPAGAVSAQRVFTWVSLGSSSGVTPTP